MQSVVQGLVASSITNYHLQRLGKFQPDNLTTVLTIARLDAHGLSMNESDESLSPYAGLANKIRGGKSASTIEFESRKPTIRITRLEAASGFRRAMKIFSIYEMLIDVNEFAVLINQEHLGELASGDSITVEVEAGLTQIKIATSIASATKSIELEMGDRVAYVCCPKLSGIILTRSD